MAAICLVNPEIAQSEMIAVKSDWSVFEDKNAKQCWVVSQPLKYVVKKDGKLVTVRRGDIRLFISYYSDNPSGVISFTPGFSPDPSYKVAITADSKSFFLAVDGDWAWATPNGDQEIINAFQRSNTVVITTMSAKGSQTTDTFSLRGYNAAIQEAAARCGVTIEVTPKQQLSPPQPNQLEAAFTKLPLLQRKKVQSTLTKAGLYKSTIDGFYGKGTEAALTSYNTQNLNGADLTKNENAGKLINAILSLEPSPSTQPKLADNATPDQTYKVASGTGFYVSDQGHIITNYHVIDGCTDMKVHSKGLTLETIQIATDAPNDLALLKVSEVPSYAFALSTTSPYSLQDIIVAGFPFGDRVSSTLKFTQGIVSSIAGIGNNYSEIQIDAALQPGNSGGPIMDDYGNIIAVAVAKLDVKTIIKDYGVVPENTNFGVKASAVRNLMEGNGVKFKAPNTEVISKQDLSRNATEGTVYLTCWMTMAQVERLRTQKVMFEHLE